MTSPLFAQPARSRPSSLAVHMCAEGRPRRTLIKNIYTYLRYNGEAGSDMGPRAQHRHGESPPSPFCFRRSRGSGRVIHPSPTVFRRVPVVLDPSELGRTAFGVTHSIRGHTAFGTQHSGSQHSGSAFGSIRPFGVTHSRHPFGVRSGHPFGAPIRGQCTHSGSAPIRGQVLHQHIANIAPRHSTCLRRFSRRD